MAVAALLVLAGCDSTNQLGGPGGFRIVDGEPQYLICESGSFIQIRSTYFADGAATVVWRASGSFEVEAGGIVDREFALPQADDVQIRAYPDLEVGDVAEISLVAPERDASIGRMFAVTREALDGHWVTVDGLASDHPCRDADR